MYHIKNQLLKIHKRRVRNSDRVFRFTYSVNCKFICEEQFFVKDEDFLEHIENLEKGVFEEYVKEIIFILNNNELHTNLGAKGRKIHGALLTKNQMLAPYFFKRGKNTLQGHKVVEVQKDNKCVECNRPIYSYEKIYGQPICSEKCRKKVWSFIKKCGGRHDEH